MPVTGKPFGQERPPLTDLLKNILLRYPDGGQILKELIQNADDAGANEVKFLFDATSYGTTSLFSPGLALFQGPALYCYNNAKFTKEDWDGLQRLMRSNKANNPLKVGRFGIGFNSVYHITDLPSIVSGDMVAFLDPHETYFFRGEPGRAFSTREPLLAEHLNQFEPFQHIFDCNLDQGRSYGGTLFRFPLRIQPSKLSNKIYTREMVNTLFDSFKKEASAILLFLKNVDSISLYEREARGEIVHLYTARVSEQSKIEVRRNRKELVQDITEEWDFAVKKTFYRLEIEKKSPGKPPEKNKWLLANQVGTTEKRLIELGMSESLKLLPWIGIAFPLDANNSMSSLGRIFCFLPLPPDGDCRTGLPVQVNGYFGLTDNRRALKWPGPDCQNDETAEWNELLLRNVGSQVYASLIINMLQEGSGVGSPELLANSAYSALPRLDRVRQDWKCIIEPFLKTVLAEEIFLTVPRGIYHWVNLGAAIIDRMNESKDMRPEIKRVVLKTLLGAGQPIVSLPEHVIQIIDQYHQMSGWRNVQQVTPELLCNVLRSNFDFHSLGMPFEDRLFVLEYALQTVPGNSHSLRGVPLLPLENRQFIKFSIPSDENIFIPSEKHIVDLLPNMKHRLLHRNLSLPAQQKLHELGDSRVTQLHHPNVDDIKELLWQNLPSDWSCDHLPQLETVTWNPGTEGHPSFEWLKLVWKWINENYPGNLNEFHGMPLIPVSVSSPSSMVRLRQNSSIIVSEHPQYIGKLSNAVCEFLKRSGCAVAEKLPSFVKHDQLLHYIALPNASGLLKVLGIAREKAVQQLSVSTPLVKRELCLILSWLDSIDSAQKSFIRTLPIFEAVDGRFMLSCQTEQGEQRLVAPRNYSLPEDIGIVDRSKILSSTKNESHRLLEKLGMVMESTASLIMIHLESFLSSENGDAEKDKLMLWILERIEILNHEMPTDFVAFIRKLPCIPTASSKRVAPNQLFDPSDKLLTRLLQDNNEAFPTRQFLGPILKRKHELQVRRVENLTTEDVLLVVNQMTKESSDRGIAVVELLNQRLELLQEYTAVGRPLNSVLRELPWLPRVCDRPKNYPELMPWYDGMKLCKPSNMRPDSLAILVGATVPVFKERLISSKVQEKLGISVDQQNISQEVIQQLHLAVVSWKNQTTTQLSLGKFEEMVRKIYMYLSTAPQSSVQDLLKSKGLNQWVWQGNGFTSPEKVALEPPSNFPRSINLHPYLFRLPNELYKVKDFLLSLGVKPQFNVDDLLVMLSIIKEKHDNEDGPREDAMQDFGQCRAVLEWIVRSCGKLSDERRSNLLIPVQTSSGKLQLEPCNKCIYCDREFLRRGASEFEVSTNSHLIHKAIPDDLAGRLRVPRLSSCLAGGKVLGIQFKEAGQYEPLTTRLRNILQQYKEGVAIFKEIIQNADDARASKVFFVVDWRENPREQLLTEELAKCQGPALWAYNDAMFSEADFENINRLAGETKKEDLEKVGRFGLGFNSVYHLTDVPSFVSGEHVVVFDPNMTHISKLMDGKMRGGGFMLSLAENKLALSAFPDQFMPYHQMFGCDMSGTGPFHFDGTLFRLPFRTTEQARESEISNEPCTPENVNNLIKSLRKSALTLLLFTQNVKEVRVFEVPKTSNPKRSLGRPLMSITKSIKQVIYTNDADKHGNGAILKNTSTWLLNIRNSETVIPSEGPRRTELLGMNVSMARSDLIKVSDAFQKAETWLVNSSAGSRSSLQVAQSADGKKNAVVPVTGVAAKISQPITAVRGEVFCFMPLSIESGFPVHVNGSFSVYSNRRRLWEQGVGEDESSKPFEAKWNEALMEDSLVQSYLQLLQVLTTCSAKQDTFHSLWPNPSKVNYPKAWEPFLHSFFNKIIDEEWQLFHCNGKWRRLQDCLILDPKLAEVSAYVTVMNQLVENVLSLPKHFMEAFERSGKEAFIKDHTLTEDKFLREFFFPNLSKIPVQKRNSVLVYILDCRLNKHRNYDDLFETYPSFSCSEDGTLLRKPNELVHPKGKVASLFSEEEKRFPLDDRFLTKERAMMLEELGMAVDSLPWSSLCERAEWISNHSDAARARFLIQYLNQMPPKDEIAPDEMELLRAARFLPILSKPKDFPFPWKSEEIPLTVLAAANNLFPERYKNLVGSSQLILDESSHPPSVPDRNLKKILGFDLKQPQLSDVITQLDHVIQLSNLLTREKKEVMCSTIYEFLQNAVTTKRYKSLQSDLREELNSRSWMLVKGLMVNPELVARNWNKENGSPYLFPLPLWYNTRFKKLIDWYGVKEDFSLRDFTEAIHKLRQDNDGKELTVDQIRNIIVLLEEVFRLADERLQDPLPLPSEDHQLYDGNELVINDTPWLEADGSNKYVHEMVPVHLAFRCGAKKLRNADLLRCSKPIGKPFGQREELTDRLKNILKAYPPDEGILKELLQNADDAKASEIHFIFDPRTHGNKHVFSDGWKHLQGPAICVYNDKPFTEEDIEGIQKLGIGSKVDDAVKTGQYGIGFNAVYHLTDCPYFISNDEIICVSDPHTDYAPTADEMNPGRLFDQLDEKFRRNYRDVFSGFLADMFKLEGSTMFRFPLRSHTTPQSKISTTQWEEEKVKKLFKLFRASAKDMLVFLNNITKISVSEMKDGILETYSVTCEVSDIAKRTEFLEKIKASSKMPTEQIKWHITSYCMKITDTNNVESNWLVTQNLGFAEEKSGSPVPNGTEMGLLPRAGIAVRLPTAEPRRFPIRHSLFCVLPLPVRSEFPVHINGHFALDSARRGLWDDQKRSDKRTVWNDFLKRQVIAPAYAITILHARNRIPGYQTGSPTSGAFLFAKHAEDGLRWYHQLFPSIAELDAAWKPVGEALYRNFLTRFPILPVATSVPEYKKPDKNEGRYSRFNNAAETKTGLTPVFVRWFKVGDTYFCTTEMSWLLENALLALGFCLLSHTPNKIHENFKAVGRSQDVSPDHVRVFLSHQKPFKDSLPRKVNDTPLQDASSIYELTKYCAKAENFFENLEGLPLLLTQDGILRSFDHENIVFCSRFSQLLPSRPDIFLFHFIRSLYVGNIEKCVHVREFCLSDLATFQAFLFPPSWINSSSHEPWNPNEQEDTFPSKEWLILLWQFIDVISSDRESRTNILKDIESWHIIPTTKNSLVPVSMSKTVLNASTYVNIDSSRDQTVQKLMVKLGCPQLNYTILKSAFSSFGGASAVLDHYLAKVHSTKDILSLLQEHLAGNTKEVGLHDLEIERLLMFLQSDYSNLSHSLLRNLPFYQTIDSTYTRLSAFNTVYEVPAGIPGDGLQVLSTVTNSIFLRYRPKLADLYKYIEIKPASSVEFYTSIVLEYFDHLTPKGRVNHLIYVRDHLLNYQHDGYNAVLAVMKQLPFLPDRSGALHPARDYYKPDQIVFKTFVPKEKFPPSPFNSVEWKDFLEKVGLQCVVTEDHFLQYAKQLEEEARSLQKPTSEKVEKILEKSNVLVSHLSYNNSLHTSSFFSQISEIYFVPAAKVKKLFVDIHPSFTQSILTCFRGSVTAEHSPLVWSSASMVASSVVPHRKKSIKMLGIHTTPPHELVITHTKNISGRFPAAEKKEVPEKLQAILYEVMTKIYNYFSKSCHSKPGPPDENCSQECKTTRNALLYTPVILVDSHTFVRGNQLAFEGFWESMKPYMFNVPRNLQQYEHFLKCLGAQERSTQLQYSSLLEVIKKNCKDNQMHPGEIPAAVDATKCLFKRLSEDAKPLQTHERRHAPDATQSLDNVRNLYLPTEAKYLKPSCEVFVNDTMEKKERLKDYWKELLIDLTMKDQEPPAKLVEYLPSHLKVQKLSSKLNEELSPNCVDQLCVADQDPTEPSCDFIKRYREIICSSEFSEALIRLYKSQEKKPKISEEVENDLKRLENGVQIKCMQTIEIRLVTMATKEPVLGSESQVSTFCQKNSEGFCILIKHGGGKSGVLHERLSSFITKITGEHVKEVSWRYLMMVLDAKDPSEISETLDEARVPQNISSRSGEPNPGDKIPEHFHYLLKNDINHHLREGELVGYEVREEDEENEAVYVYAKIIEKTSTGDGTFAFNSRYKIDIGEDEPIEVSKLKLYKFDRDERDVKRGDGVSLVPYLGTETENSSQQDAQREPVTLEEAKKEVAEALKEIWEGLPESERSSAIKRLIRRWHPDKNPHRTQLATEVTQFLLNEVERLKKGGIPGYHPETDNSRKPSRSGGHGTSTWDAGPNFWDFSSRYQQRSRRQRDRYRDWSDHRYRGTDDYSGTAYRRRTNNEFEPANRDESERWMRQSQKDFEGASCLLQNEYYFLACFHSHQTVEKALKALMFAKGRFKKSDRESHDLLELAYRASGIDASLRVVQMMVGKIQGYYIKTRYPDYYNLFSQHSIPADYYTRDDADEAILKAREILRLIREVLN
ncbi:sacsin-like [Dendronephthya gigantea]|uniref:sacsin-like n=1 Tax=Dendronephthya gigantea TaxID=151771 RepID=UPI00106D88F9|nr:sacsin-like [Dendronephthya gigantea]